jgi:hypothetical protein
MDVEAIKAVLANLVCVEKKAAYRLAIEFNFGQMQDKVSSKTLLEEVPKMREMAASPFAENARVPSSLLLVAAWWRFEDQDKEVLQAVADEISIDLQLIESHSKPTSPAAQPQAPPATPFVEKRLSKSRRSSATVCVVNGCNEMHRYADGNCPRVSTLWSPLLRRGFTCFCV